MRMRTRPAAHLVVVCLLENLVLEELVGVKHEEQLEPGLLGVEVLEADVGEVLQGLYG